MLNREEKHEVLEKLCYAGYPFVETVHEDMVAMNLKDGDRVPSVQEIVDTISELIDGVDAVHKENPELLDVEYNSVWFRVSCRYFPDEYIWNIEFIPFRNSTVRPKNK